MYHIPILHQRPRHGLWKAVALESHHCLPVGNLFGSLRFLHHVPIRINTSTSGESGASSFGLRSGASTTSNQPASFGVFGLQPTSSTTGGTTTGGFNFGSTPQ